MTAAAEWRKQVTLDLWTGLAASFRAFDFKNLMRRPQSRFHQNLNRFRFISQVQVYSQQEVQVEVQVDSQQGVYVDRQQEVLSVKCKQHIQVDS